MFNVILFVTLNTFLLIDSYKIFFQITICEIVLFYISKIQNFFDITIFLFEIIKKNIHLPKINSDKCMKYKELI